MVLVHNGFSSYRPSAAYVTAARLIAGLTEVARRLSERSWLTLTNDLRDSEYRIELERAEPRQRVRRAL
jgi:hypothetical protein